MPSLGELIHNVRAQLTGLGSTSDTVAALLQPMNTTDLTVHVDDASGLGAGTVIEVGTEMMRVKSADPASSTVQLYPFGRGYNGTEATAHAPGVEVTLNPTFPTSVLLREINGVLGEIYPRVYGVKAVDLAPGTIFSVGVLPDDAVAVVSVFVQSRVSGHWAQVLDWSYHPDLRQLALPASLVDYPYRIVYATRPRQFDADLGLDQDFETVTGLDARVTDLLAMGVAVRLAPMLDIARLPFATAEARAMGDGRQSGAGGTSARLLYSMFQARIDQESAILAKEHPIKTNRTR